MIDILLATYNGEQYIKQQIYSLLSQTYEDWNLIIHDDGSSDNTISIVKSFCQNDARVKFIEDNIRFGNPAENFIHLLKYSNAEYIMFCDQDDIWFDNKIELMLSHMINLDSHIPQVIYSNAYVWEPNNGIKGLATLTFPKNVESFLFLNSGMQGCVSLFNDKMRDFLILWKGTCAMHDHLLHLTGLTLGKVTYLDTPLMLYRMHQNNVTGGTATKIISLNKIIKNSKVPVIDKSHYNAVRKFVEIYQNYIGEDKLNVINQYMSMPEKNIFQRWKTIIKYKFRIYDSVSKLILKTILRPFFSE
jgi:rhamnosyltransferase